METNRNIYVISNCWDRDGATVIGAAVELDGAMEIGDPIEHRSGTTAGSWAPWEVHDPDIGERFARWTRSGLNRDGSPHVSLYQEIVQVPLAGAALIFSVKGREATEAALFSVLSEQIIRAAPLMPEPLWANPDRDVMADIKAFMRRAEEMRLASDPFPPPWATPHYRET